MSSGGFDLAQQLLGPLGGLIGLSFGLGAGAGWGFAMLVLKPRITELRADMEQRDKRCDERIAKLEARVKEVEDERAHSMERQLSQVRQSTVEVFRGPK